MDNALIIDGIDIYSEYGIYVADNGYKELVAYPPMKAVKANEWHEHDGIEPDLSQPVLDAREFSVTFAASGLFNRLPAFMEMLSREVYHRFDFRAIKRSYTLRLAQMPSLDYNPALSKFTLQFANDMPSYGSRPAVLPTVRVRNEMYYIDDKALSDYSCAVLQGTLSDILKEPQVRPNLTRDIAGVNGALYDGEAAADVRYKSKEIKVQLLMRATSLTNLWADYDALLYDLTRPGERVLQITANDMAIGCYYKSCEVAAFYPDDCWLQFTLTLVAVNGLTDHADETVLTTEDGAIIVCEDNESAIDVLPVEKLQA